MGESRYIYRCSVCDVMKDYRENEPAPICCAMPMVAEELPACLTAPHAEMARTDVIEEPCDDGRGHQFSGKRDA